MLPALRAGLFGVAIGASLFGAVSIAIDDPRFELLVAAYAAELAELTPPGRRPSDADRRAVAERFEPRFLALAETSSPDRARARAFWLARRAESRRAESHRIGGADGERWFGEFEVLADAGAGGGWLADPDPTLDLWPGVRALGVGPWRDAMLAALARWSRRTPDDALRARILYERGIAALAGGDRAAARDDWDALRRVAWASRWSARAEARWTRSERLGVGRAAPVFATRDLDGNRVALEDYAGAWTVVAFVDEAPLDAWAAFARERRGTPFALIVIGRDPDRASWRRRTERLVDVAAVVDEAGSERPAQRAFSASDEPLTVLLDPEHRVALVDPTLEKIADYVDRPRTEHRRRAR